MSALTERVKCGLIGTPLGDLAQRVSRGRQRRALARDPKLAEVAEEERHLDAFVREHVRDGANCVDAGCHLGSVLSTFRRLSPTGRHVAFEPTPRKAALLRRKLGGGGVKLRSARRPWATRPGPRGSTTTPATAASAACAGPAAGSTRA